MHDLARLGVARRVVLGRLEQRELTQRGAGELGAEEHRLQARDQRVAAEHRHEPRHPGGGKLAAAGVVGRAHAQGGQIVHRLAERLPQVVPRRADLRDAQLPGVDRLGDPCALLAEVPLDHVGLAPQRSVGAEPDVDAHRPRLARREREVVGDSLIGHVAPHGEDHLRTAVPVRIDEMELVGPFVVLDRDRARQRLRMHWDRQARSPTPSPR